jgi:hypothetical protein
LDALTYATSKNENMHRATIQALQDRIEELQQELVQKSRKVTSFLYSVDMHAR